MPTDNVKKICPAAASQTLALPSADQSGVNMKLSPSVGLQLPAAAPMHPVASATACPGGVSTRITRNAAKMNRIGIPILASFSIPPISPLLTTQMLTLRVITKNRIGVDIE